MQFRQNELLKEKMAESLASALPITAIVLVLSVTIAPLEPGTLILFLFGALMLIFGMGLFTLGVDMSMLPMGEGIGIQLSRSRRIVLSMAICLLLGAVITIAEPDLQVLAEKVPAIPNLVLILTVAAGVGVFLVIAELRMLLKIPLSYTLIFFYGLVFLLSFFTPNSFIPVSFDSGGVTTGPITVPFIMALGIGMASIRSDKNSSSDSFGLIALCSIGPILSVMILGIFYQPDSAAYTSPASNLVEVVTTRSAAKAFTAALPVYAAEVAGTFLPVVAMFFIFQLVSRRFHRHQLLRIGTGLVYSYIGLVLFLTGVSVGFMPAGEVIGIAIAESGHKWMLVPVGMLIGYFIVKAEPAVQVLTKQVEEISNGSITQRSIQLALSAGICISSGLAMLRILTGLNILWILAPGYLVSLALALFVPQIFTGIAFDSGGVASGPMTATFLLPLAMGACEALGGNLLTDAFGIVALVAMTPLCTIQLLGLAVRFRQRAEKRRMQARLDQMDDCMVYFDA
ncbi:MAG: DUF1538 family protein [Oscillospiraceae bacterium]|jgi:hypothetical protein|nr:DUF1538 family protein [Oscillospiraceae bacterium]